LCDKLDEALLIFNDAKNRGTPGAHDT